MKKKLIISTVLVVAVLVFFLFRSCNPFVKSIVPIREYHCTNVGVVDENYVGVFNDKPSVQVVAARRYGMSPIEEEDMKQAVSDGRLTKIGNTNLYYLSHVTYPYLTPAAQDLLAQIGVMYRVNMDGSRSRLRVTSCLRTDEYIRQLKTTNRNAVSNSCHLYGTTFDISYNYLSKEQKQALARALESLRRAGYCYVKYEINQPCFHITSRQ